MILMFLAITAVADLWANDKPAPLAIQPVVEAEEDVYNFAPANNGAGPMWCSGSTCLVRIGDDVFASGLETLKDAKPLNNCRWTLYQRTAAGWQLVQADPAGRTRHGNYGFAGCLHFPRLASTLNTEMAISEWRDAESAGLARRVLTMTENQVILPSESMLRRKLGALMSRR